MDQLLELAADRVGAARQELGQEHDGQVVPVREGGYVRICVDGPVLDAARLERVPEDPVEAVRRALRQAKSLLETGEVLVNSPRPHGVRPRSVLGGVVDGWEKRAQGKGLL